MMDSRRVCDFTLGSLPFWKVSHLIVKPPWLKLSETVEMGEVYIWGEFLDVDSQQGKNPAGTSVSL